jgi:hypothetical protein
MYVTVSALGVALAWTLLLLQVEPVPTWFYVFVWYPTLTLADGVSSRIRGDPPLLSHPGLVASLFLWSPVVWLLFEAINFRIANWYYVFLPAPLAERWTGILLSFATVVPAVILAERMLHALGSGRRWRIRPIRTRSWELHAALLIGLASLALALARPQLFFPLVWGAVWLLADPYVARHRAEWSLLRDLEKGEVGRIVRLMLGGLAIGLLWESYNAWARGKWIYTVPWLEELKLFEMPPFGFLGFPFFALEAWSLYHALCVVGVAVPVGQADWRGPGSADGSSRTADRQIATPRRALRPIRSLAAGTLALAFSIATLLGMERWTISSVVPTLAEVPGITLDQVRKLRAAGFGSAFDLGRSQTTFGRRSGIPSDVARDLQESARLITLRGIGAEHGRRLATFGIRTVCQLRDRDPTALWTMFHDRTAVARSTGPPIRPTPAEVRVWVRAAQRHCP